ncbi:MAG: PAS domain-containing protein [Planctomycetota bacterium]
MEHEPPPRKDVAGDLPYREYFESLPAYLTVQDRDLRIIRANQRFREDFGDPDGRYCYQLYKHRSEKCEVCPATRTFRDGREYSSEEHVRTRDGREMSVIVFTTPIRNAAGEITSVMELSADITGIKLLQGQLRESRKRYRTLFEEVPCFISIQDPDLRIAEANRMFRESFGDRLGEKCYEVYKHRSEECIPCAVKETFRDGCVHHSEEVVTSTGGRSINTLVYSAPLRDADGTITRVMEMSADITPIRELQGQLESIGLLISSVSHGVKGLLNGMDGGMYLLKTGIEKQNSARQEQGLEMVQRNVDRIRSMVLNILYYAKERTPNLEFVPARELGDEVVAIQASRAQELKVRVESALDADAGEFAADRQAVRSLLVNLLENALDACRVDDKKTDHRVTFQVQGTSDAVIFEVSDNGIGMDRETREKAFSLFFTSKGVKGTGLGLFIANKIARAHGGRIELESELGQGTRIRVHLPRRHEGAFGG